jgi:propanediol utilization protein
MMQIFDHSIDTIVDRVVNIIEEKIKDRNKQNTIPVEASGRHIHLCREHIDILFGEGYELTKKRELSQPGQYLCNEKVTLIGSKGSIQNVSILGPARPNTQVEISKTDSVLLGVKAPVRESGDIKRSSSMVIASCNGLIRIEEGVIAAKRHIHMTPEDAQNFNVVDKQIVGIEILSDRSVIFGDVVVRVNKNYRLSVHIDYDEANACSYEKGMEAKIIKWEGIKIND